ncbi:MAG: hypothetical protein WD232_05095 [Acidimicrobiales bacterium]
MPVIETLEWEITVDDRWICPTCVKQLALEEEARAAAGSLPLV